MLEQLGQDIWSAQTIQPIGGGVRFPARMVIIRLADGLWIHSPIPIDDALAAEIEALGEVRYLVSPNCFHHLHLGPAQARWPQAQVHAPAGLAAKRPDLTIHVTHEAGAQPWPEFAPLVEIEGVPEIDEFVFLHQPSKTLVLCDLSFNMRDVEGFMSRLALRLAGAWQRTAQSKLWRVITKDRAAAGASCARVLALDFERALVSHGDPIEGPDAKAKLQEALSWMLSAHQDNAA